VVLLDVICLVVALVAIAFAVIALVRSRSTEERAAAAATAVARAETAAQAAVAGLEQLEAKVAQGRQDAANAAQQATRAAQAAASAQAAAAASRREAETASDKASQAEAEAARIEATMPTSKVEASSAAGAETASSPGRATVQRAEDHDVARGGAGATERVVQVAWRLERVRNTTWALRNTGLAKAQDALLSDATVPPKFVRPDEVIPRDVERDDVLQFRVTAGRGAPPPRIRVTWREGAGSPAYSREFTVLTAP
jgi:hypothetical protein